MSVVISSYKLASDKVPQDPKTESKFLVFWPPLEPIVFCKDFPRFAVNRKMLHNAIFAEAGNHAFCNDS